MYLRNEHQSVIKSEIEIDKNQFQLFSYLPKEKSDTMIFFTPGLNGSGITIQWFDSDVFYNNYVCSYDPRGQTTNKAKASSNYRKYLSDMHVVIEHFTKLYNIKNIILIGESWGGALSLLYKKLYNPSCKVCTWNTPYTPKDIGEKRKGDFVRKVKMATSFVTGIDFTVQSFFEPKLTNDPVFARMAKMTNRTEISSKVLIACWLSLIPSWRYLLKNGSSKNVTYIQGGEDALADHDRVKKLAETHSSIVYLDKGYHCLIQDKSAHNQLLDYITKLSNVK